MEQKKTMTPEEIKEELMKRIKDKTTDLERIFKGESDITVEQVDPGTVTIKLKGLPYKLSDDQMEQMRVFLNTTHILGGKEEG
jgi:hypothetical protein